MDLASALDRFGDSTVLSGAGLLVGGLFGYFAQRSGFCLRSAVIEFWHGRFGQKLAIWLLAFGSAVLPMQWLTQVHAFDTGSVRLIAVRGSLSGALVGGLLFGAGMIMARGCNSRLLVLSATGNLRALLSGLVFAVAAQASLAGALSPLRNTVSSWWTVEAGQARDLLWITGLGPNGGLVLALGWMLAGLYFALRTRLSLRHWVGAIGTGLMVALTWWLTFTVSRNSFGVVPVQGLSFSGPSAEWLMRTLTLSAPPPGFDFGLIPGVFLGALVAGLLGRDFHLVGFRDGYSMPRYILGAIFMGLGSMMAGGCAVGAGVSGGAIFALTSWLTLAGMWSGAGLTDWLLDRQHRPAVGVRMAFASPERPVKAPAA